ncbi:hypothetical protein Bra471DRAFT_04264 [Bradyrhizobium sp. WSM471]|nr:hypothetical protein Bra471DRAFT_04264 [Bradyrhizobium sp. WSM471]
MRRYSSVAFSVVCAFASLAEFLADTMARHPRTVGVNNNPK